MLRRALHWLVVAAVVSLFGAFEGVYLMRSLNDAVPGVLDALHAHADPVPLRPSSPERRVVVVVVDGLGADAFDARLREGALGGVIWREVLDSGVPSRSRPVYHAILTGVPQWVAGIRGNGYATARADSVADRVRAGGGRVAWMLENETWFCELFCGPDDVVVEGAAATSPEAFAGVWEAGPALTVVHLTEVDEAGHLFGADSESYVAASRRAMATVEAFRAIARAKGEAALWLVGADHGHTPRGGHGGPEATVRRVTWVALQDGGARGETSTPETSGIPGDTVASLAPTIARALGVDAPRESVAPGLALSPAVFGQPFEPSAARVRAVEAARARAGEAFLGTPRTRGGLIITVLGVTLALLALVRRRRGVAEAAVFVVAIAGFFLTGPGLSMSSERTEGWYLAHGLCSLTVFAMAAWLAARRWASPMACAVVCAVFPAIALVAMRGSLGVSDATPVETVLWPSLGLVPASVCAAIAFVEALVALRARRARR